jgi:hypothetical protein
MSQEAFKNAQMLQRTGAQTNCMGSGIPMRYARRESDDRYDIIGHRRMIGEMAVRLIRRARSRCGHQPTSAFMLLATLMVAAAAPAASPPGGGSGGAGGTAATAAAANPSSAGTGGAPTSPNGFFSQSSINFARPQGGWANWWSGFAVPPGERKHNYYLCYDIEQTSDANVPFVFKNVDILASERSIQDASMRIPCHSTVPSRSARPILRGDRLRVVIDMTGDAAKTFYQNVSMLNLNVVLTVAPPIQVTLLRTNLGGATTTTGLGGNQAPESSTYAQHDYRCFFEILGFLSTPTQERVCTGPENVQIDAAGHVTKAPNDQQKDMLILPWPYTFPGDVIPTIYVSALYTTPGNGQAWQPATFYPGGSVVQCPGENYCTVTATSGTSRSGTPDHEPNWTTASGMADGSVVWTPIGSVNYRLPEPHKTHLADAPDGKPVYQVGDTVVWTSGPGQIEATIVDWQAQTLFTPNSVVICPAPGAIAYPLHDERLCTAVTGGTSGTVPPQSWVTGVVDHDLTWTVNTQAIDQSHTPQARWMPDTLYNLGNAVRCEPSAQKANLCVATVGGYSGQAEPWWASSSGTSSATPTAAGVAATPSSQRDNQILWGQFTPSTGTPSADQVVNLGAQELTQVHAPDLWGLSTAVLYTTKRIPNSYSFTHTVTAGCPTYTPPMPATSTTPAVPAKTVYCPDIFSSYQRATDIALMVSPYVFHHWYAKFHDTADGIDTETKWSATQPQDWIPEPIAGFGLNSVGNSFYVGLSLEIFVRNLQLVAGYGWIKAPNLTNPISASGTNTVTPNTYTAFRGAPFIGLAFNIAGLISGH